MTFLIGANFFLLRQKYISSNIARLENFVEFVFPLFSLIQKYSDLKASTIHPNKGGQNIEAQTHIDGGVSNGSE